MGVPEKMLSVMSFHQGMMASVRSSGEVSDSFIVSNGTKEDCVLALLFSLYLRMLSDFSLRQVAVVQQQCLIARTEMIMQTIHDLHFAENSALVAYTLEDMQ